KDITAGGAITLNATSRWDTRIETGNLHGGSVSVTASGTAGPEEGSAAVLLGDVQSTIGNISLTATGVSFGAADIKTGFLDAAMDLDVDAKGDVHPAATASVEIDGVHAGGNADIYAGAPTGDPITINGDVDVGGSLYIWNRTNGNVAVSGAITAGGEVKIDAIGAGNNQGRIDVTGPITGASVN